MCHFRKHSVSQEISVDDPHLAGYNHSRHVRSDRGAGRETASPVSCGVRIAERFVTFSAVQTAPHVYSGLRHSM